MSYKSVRSDSWKRASTLFSIIVGFNLLCGLFKLICIPLVYLRESKNGKKKQKNVQTLALENCCEIKFTY